MDEENAKFRDKITKLEEALEDKDIVIKLLLEEIKKYRAQEHENKRKRHCTNDVTSKKKRIQEKEDILPEENFDMEKKPKNHSKSEEAATTIESCELKKINWKYSYNLENDLIAMFGRKRIVRNFNISFLFEEFIDFVADFYVIKEFEFTKIVHSKNIENYLKINKHKILKFLIKNINTLAFSAVCSALLVLSTEFTEIEKLVIIHDIILYLNDYSKLCFFSFFILNSELLLIEQDPLKFTIHSILSFQYLVDAKIHKTAKSVISSLDQVKNKLHLINTEFLEKHLMDLDYKIMVFVNCKINPDIYKYIYAIRALGQFLDWDYVYNTYILEFLAKDCTGCKLLYMGILALNSVRLFGDTESTGNIFKFLEQNMDSVSDNGLSAFLILKQVNEKISQEYLESKSTELIEKGYDLEYLKKLLVY